MTPDNVLEPHRDFKSGLVAIVGAPNAGKSTLLNRLLGQKISITSKKPQTTRNRILGVMDRPGAQLIFLDTPGVHRAGKPLNVRIVDVALSTLADADLVLVMMDAAAPDSDAENYLIEKLAARATPAVLALNKIDLIHKPQLLALIERWSRAHNFTAVVPVSAVKGTQLDGLVDAMIQVLPQGPPLFPPGSLTDLPERFIAGEMIREKVFRLTGEEVPYAVAVTIDAFKEEKGGRLVKIHATIHVERNSQKGIVIGKGGAKLKQIGEAARREIERMLGCRVFLKLFVRVQKNWSRDSKAMARFGY
ncbi:GTPase Era [Desulfatitalea alkaliphila]|uniref:GTPase Era n=1 Tax=Desulfatitalea alkaliphila TaxID=2929485 RepID=A0AA41QZJ7_9BACT|nr:GTPase Era [Desulfatitalea alkaliphila]MCJ8499278.1 GTPase Era [Desulfatitalea alkaliphila]